MREGVSIIVRTGQTDFNLVSDEEIARVEHIINTRPRAVLGFKTPNEVLLEHLMAD